MQTKKRKIGLYGLLHSLKTDLSLNEGDIERFVESVEANPEDLHEVVYKLAQHCLITDDTLNTYLDVADLVESSD